MKDEDNKTEGGKERKAMGGGEGGNSPTYLKLLLSKTRESVVEKGEGDPHLKIWRWEGFGTGRGWGT